MSQQPPWQPQQVSPTTNFEGMPPQPSYEPSQWGQQNPTSWSFTQTQPWTPMPPQPSLPGQFSPQPGQSQPYPGQFPPFSGQPQPFPGQFPPQPEQFPPQAGQFRQRPPSQFDLPPGEGGNRGLWSRRRGAIIGLVCGALLSVLLLGYGLTAALGNGGTSTPAPTPTSSGQLTVVSPTAVPTQAPTPVPTHTPAPTPTPRAQATPTLASTPSPTPKPTTVQVAVYNSGFRPSSVTIAAGSTVIWTNQGGIPHTATDSGVFDSGKLNVGSTYRFTFTHPGTYHYVCTYHPNMVGTIIVQ